MPPSGTVVITLNVSGFYKFAELQQAASMLADRLGVETPMHVGRRVIHANVKGVNVKR